jgi:pyruvate dehydrogenase E2 component (dihydrolipoamide acetyltransferase)
MAVPITVPRLGWSMDEGNFVEWRKSDGDRIGPGDTLFVLESDKAAEEITALDAGILRIPPDSPKPGDRVQVGQVLAFLVAEGEELPAEDRGQKTEDRSQKSEVRGQKSEVSEEACVASLPSGQPAISPRARRVARELGLDWRGVPGSGRNGRIRERDVRAAATTQFAGRMIPHTHVRRTIAARMVAGVTQAAPVTLTTRADATNLVNLHQQFQVTAAGPEFVPSYTDIILKLTAVALRQHPLLQAQWRDEGLFVPDRIDLAMAVDTDIGLFAPVVREVDKLTLRQVAAQARDLIARARVGQLTAGEMRDATFTITNLGSLGVDAFTPIIQLPQCAVLGIGRIVREPAVVDEKIVPRDRMTLSLTFDHRVVDGAPAARFLETLRQCLEQPAAWLV